MKPKTKKAQPAPGPIEMTPEQYGYLADWLGTNAAEEKLLQQLLEDGIHRLAAEREKMWDKVAEICGLKDLANVRSLGLSLLHDPVEGRFSLVKLSDVYKLVKIENGEEVKP